MSRAVIPATLCVALLVVALVFIAAPGIDLEVARAFYAGQNRFVGDTPLGEAVRRVVYWVPTAVLLLCLACYVARRFASGQTWAPTGRAVVMLLVSFLVGPGLLTNVILKDHSHRPRPVQTREFGGDEAFRPFYTFDGACRRNCSFVSGEGSAAFWTLAPALLVPPPAQAAAVAASLVFSVGVGTLRMAFGGHYLSDTIFAALLTWSVVWLCWVWFLGRRQGWLTRQDPDLKTERPSDHVRPVR